MSNNKELSPEVLTRHALDKALVAKMDELKKYIAAPKNRVGQVLFNFLDSEVIIELLSDELRSRYIPDDCSNSELVAILSDKGALSLQIMLDDITLEHMDEVKAGIARSVASSEEWIKAKKLAEKSLAGAVTVESTEEDNTRLIEDLNTSISEITSEFGWVNDLSIVTCYGSSFLPNIKTGAVTGINRLIGNVKATLQAYKLTPACRTAMVNLLVKAEDTLAKVIKGSDATDLSDSKSGILLAPIGVVKPRPKYVPCGLEDTKKGVVVTYPKGLVAKYGVGIVLNLGVLCPESTVDFHSDHFDCLAIRSHTKLGTMLLLQLKGFDTLKLEEGSVIGTLVRK